MLNGKRKSSVGEESDPGGDLEESGKRSKNEEQSESIISLLVDDEEEEHILSSKDGPSSSLPSESLSSPSSSSSSSTSSTSSLSASSSSPSPSLPSSSSSKEQPNSLSSNTEGQNNSNSTERGSSNSSSSSKEESVPTLATTVNYKRILMERLLSEPTRCPAPAYVTKAVEGKGHESVLSFVLAGMETVIVGRGLTPKAAEQDAARQAIEVYPTVRASAPPVIISSSSSDHSSSFSSLSHRSVLTSGMVVQRENTNYISTVYSRLKASFADPTAKPVPDYYSYKMNGQKAEWETSLKFTLGNGKTIKSIGRGPTKLDSERDAARRALEKTW